MLRWFPAARFAYNAPLLAERRLLHVNFENDENVLDNPDGGSPQREQSQDTAQCVEGISEQTHERVERAVEQSPQAKKPHDVLKNIEGLHGMMQEVKIGMEKPNVREYVQKKGGSTANEIWEGNLQFIDRESANLHKWIAIVNGASEWEERELTPEAFIESMRVLYGDLIINFADGQSHTVSSEEGKAILQQLETYAAEHQGELAHWSDLSSDVKNRIIRETKEIAKLDGIIAMIDQNTDLFKASIESKVKFMRTKIEEIEKAISEKIDTAAGGHHGGGISGFIETLGIEFYSINEIYEAFKQVKEAWTSAYHEHVHHKATPLAKRIGEAIPNVAPLSTPTRIILDNKAESQNNKEKNEYKEYLTSRNTTFRGLFEPGGLMDQNLHDTNKARSVLEYAASRGWLYDISENKGRAHKFFFKRYALDAVVPTYWSKQQTDDYFTDLLGQNYSGVESEKEKADKREKTNDVYELFIKAYDREIDNLNFWAAIGIAQAALRRGLIGEASPWLTTRIFRKIREDAEVRKHISREVLDELGKLSLYTSYFTLGYVKAERDKIYPWIKKEPPSPLNEAGTMGQAIDLIEKDIEQKSGRSFEAPEDKYELDRLVAKVLSGQTVKVATNKYVSIFDTKYVDTGYHEPRNFPETDPAKEDEDYYRSVSDIMLADAAIIGGILKITGSGQFTHGSRSSNLIDQILKHRKSLLEESPEAAKNFNKITKDKLINWIEPWLQENRAGPAAGENLPDQKTPAILHLVLADLIPYELIEQKARESKFRGASPLLCERLMEQIADPATNSTQPNLRDRAFAQLPDTLKDKIRRARGG